MKRYLIASAPVLVALTALSTPAAADQQADMAKAGLTLGVSLTKALAASFPPPEVPVDNAAAKQAVEGILGDYQQDRARMLAGVATARANTDFAIDTAAIMATASGVGAVPAIVFKTSAQLASDALYNSIQSQVEDTMAGFLSSRRGQIEAATGASLEQLHDLPPAELRDRIQQNADVVAALRAMLPGDQGGQAMASELLISGIQNVSRETLSAVARNEQRMSEAEAQFAKFAGAMATWQDQTSAAVDKHTQEIMELDQAVGDLQSSVAGIDARLQTQERNQGVIADFVFDQMDPAAKAAALRSGFMAKRFACQDGGADCDAAALKGDLIKRFDSEARVKNVVGQVQGTIQDLSDLSKIAKNIGLDVPGLADTANYGVIATTAFSQFSSGNYLGAVASLTGAFGHQVDPDQQRFQIMMKYLGQQFDHINVQLKQVQENQQKLMDAIGGLSKQLADYQKSLDDRLDGMEFELGRVSDAVRQQATGVWKQCYAIYSQVTASDYDYHYKATGDFESIDDLYRLKERYGEPMHTCLETALTQPVSLIGSEWLGNFLSASTAIRYSPENLDVTGSGSLTKETLRSFVQDIYTPASALLGMELEGERLSWATAMAWLAAPGTAVSTKTGNAPSPSPDGPALASCAEDGPLRQARLYRLLCSDGDPERSARQLLSSPMVTETAVSLAEVLLVASRLLDIRDQANTTWVPRDELAGWAASHDGVGGRSVVTDTLMVLDAVVANYTVAYGELTARGMLRALQARQAATGADAASRAIAADAARKLAAANGYLAANAAMILLWERYMGGATAGHPEKVSDTLVAYRAALAFARSPDQVNRFELLHDLFGDDLVFDYDAAADRALLVLDPGSVPVERVVARLPTPEMFEAGRLIYPPRMAELQHERERVIDRLLDYNGLHGRSSAELSAFVAALGRTDRSTAGVP